MTTLKFVDTHNMVACVWCLNRGIVSFEKIVDFINAHTIKYVLTINPTIYTSCIEQFWAIVKAKTINGEVQLQALADAKKIIITESIVRRDLQLEDAEGVDCLPNATIFEQLTLMSSKTTAWNKFSSNMTSAIICLATNQKFNFSKYIFESGGPRRQETMGDTIAQTRVLDLETTKTTQANEIASSKRRVKKLEKKNKSRTHKLKRLYKVGLSARVESSRDEESLGEDASKQGRRITAIDDEDITLVNDQIDVDAEMFDVDTLTGDEVLAEQVVVAKDVNLSVDEVTLAQALAALKSAKYSAATTTTATIPTPRKGIVFQEPGKTTISSQQPSQANVQDKGKGKIIEPGKPMKKKELIRLDEEIASKLQAEFDEEVKIKADHELAQRLQAQEQEELSNAKKATLFAKLLEKRRKHFATKRAEEKRNKPPTQAQQRKIMCTYLKNMEGKNPKYLKNKSFDSTQKMFDRAFKRVNTFIDFKTDLVKGSSKRAGEELEQESSKKQKVDDDKETIELKSIIEGRIVEIKILLDDLRVTAAQLMLLVYKLLLLVLKVNAASTKVIIAQRLRLLKEFLLYSTLGTTTHSSASSYSIASLSHDHPLTHVSPTPTPTRVLFHRRTVRMTVRAQPATSPGHSARVAEAMALSDLAFRKRYRSSYETPSPSSSLTLPVRKRYRGTSELILDTDSEGDEFGEEDKEDESDEDHGLDDESQGLEDEGLGLEEEEAVPKGLSSAKGLRWSSRAERVSAFRQPTLDTWDRSLMKGSPPPSLSCSLGSYPVSHHLPVSPSSPVVPSPIASPVATPIATISRLDALPPTLVADIDRDVRELYTRSGAVRDEIFSQRLVLALEAWAGHVNTRLADMLRARYDNHKLIHDMLVQQAAMQRELQGMKGRVTALEQERGRREQ
ncbi:hypothetical protein Tco_0453254 [Tanacetum coccineum]